MKTVELADRELGASRRTGARPRARTLMLASTTRYRRELECSESRVTRREAARSVVVGAGERAPASGQGEALLSSGRRVRTADRGLREACATELVRRRPIERQAACSSARRTKRRRAERRAKAPQPCDEQACLASAQDARQALSNTIRLAQERRATAFVRNEEEASLSTTFSNAQTLARAAHESQERVHDGEDAIARMDVVAQRMRETLYELQRAHRLTARALNGSTTGRSGRSGRSAQRRSAAT